MLEEADYGLTDQAFNAGQQNRYIGDENLFVKFFMHPRLDQSQSKKMGRPIYSEAVYVQIMQPGNKDSIIIRPATSLDKNRFAKLFAKFQQGEAQIVDGTPLAEWPKLTRSQVEELRYFNIYTVEQLAEMSDSNAQNIMGANLLRDSAKAFLAACKTTQYAEQLEAEKTARETEIASLRDLVTELQATVKALTQTEE